jgi:hypothetical protein
MVKKLPSLIFQFVLETLGLPTLIKSVYKVLIYQLKFGSSLLKTIVVAVFTDPIIFFMTVGILLWFYIDDLLSVATP